ncbi:TPA: hypothetical protein TUW61_001487 [Streptococcus equi subsp. zooepidemicus]|uniref:hypothetical protein n=1 Tax=Streptococcus equi TaxID=1336 RepID=UPI0012B1356E|nr:hypothetical protein [Streptococcus equi]MCD3400942.1 hypothetical protein [Streptococcus equi subsp. zooepidemicus]MCD3413499.1 hypothetical protein [Streptococcus equi subsp. zooepidemicus]MCD3430975.1 hypothetical protein [Streptococcus equi subsp. zooepidemicus]QGM23527.1 hypothetical protein GJS33_05045 [Streptococcus equi subsp. zooepidemicus]UFR15975.1 hypothetical protein KVP03_07400 [Streptococcus equi subsp. zooepidemicus]
MNNQAKLFRTVHHAIEFDYAMIEQATEYFEDYVEKGIILTQEFAANKWQMTNEYANISFLFNVNTFQYNRYYEPLLGVAYTEFVDYLKSFIILSMDKHVLPSLQYFLRDIKRLIKETRQNILEDVTGIKITSPTLCIDFFSSLPCYEDTLLNQLMEQLDNMITTQYAIRPKQQRKLAQFQSYFTFNDILTDYWSKELPEEERLFYYPLYLWWQITAVVPLRPREFLLTPQDCLSENEGKFFLTLRRNNLKGKDKSVSHKISEDYYQTTYEIPLKLAESIQEYMNLTKNQISTELSTLFTIDSHYKKWNRSAGSNNRFLTYTNLNTILKYFFNEVISEQYGYEVHYINSPSRLKENEINYIHIGDTRHIAMINLIAEGSSPVTAMLLAGHDNVTTSSHYFSNLSQFIECRSYQMYRKLTSSQTAYEISKSQPRYTIGKSYIQLDNKGRCYSPRYAAGDFSDCLKVISFHAELGACTSCPFYRKLGKDYFSMDNSYKKSIDEEALIVDQAIKRVREGKGHIEEIGEALLKLKTVSHSYQEYLATKQIALEEETSG